MHRRHFLELAEAEKTSSRTVGYVMSVYSDGFNLHLYFWVQQRTTNRCPQGVLK